MSDVLTNQPLTEDERMAHFMKKIENDEKIEADDWMPDEYRNALIKLISMHGISEIMGRPAGEGMGTESANPQRKLGIMAKVQDEMGHGQLIIRVAEDLMKPYGKKREHILQDLFNGDLKFHNVFHMEAESWGDAGLIGWLVDGAAIITQTDMLGASYGPYAGRCKGFARRRSSMPSMVRRLSWLSQKGHRNKGSGAGCD